LAELLDFPLLIGDSDARIRDVYEPCCLYPSILSAAVD